MLETGDREVIKAVAESATNNAKAAVAFGNETRKLFRELEKEVSHLRNQLRARDSEIDLLKKHVANLQQKTSAGGT